MSRTTVSNAYNRPDQLSPQLRQRVLETARRLGYPGPDPVARSLRTKRAGSVGLLFTERLSYAFHDPGAVTFLEGLASVCELHGSGLVIVPCAPDSDEPDGSLAIRRAAVDGFVVYSMPDRAAGVTAVLSRGVPTVIVDSPVGLGEAAYVGINDSAACAEVARHVADLGHRSVGVVTTRLAADGFNGLATIQRQRGTDYRLAAARLAGFAQGLSAASVDWTQVPVQERHEHTVEDGEAAAEALLSARPDLTAILCVSDVYAHGVLRYAERAGIRVPEDLSVSGFDDTPDAARHGLTTVRQPMAEKGRTAGRLLLGETSSDGNSGPPSKTLLPTELVIRTSTAAPSTR